MSDDLLDDTRRSWNLATRAHNRHKRDQAGFLRGGGSTLFPEETELLGELGGQRLLHLLCNAGQDTLSLASRGARVTGVDLSDEAIAFATQLAADANLPATFLRAEAQAFLAAAEPASVDVVFMSYGALIWIADIGRLFRGIARVLAPGGRFVSVDFHPLSTTLGDDLRSFKEPYFAPGHVYSDPVDDYVGASGGGLTPSGLAALPGDEATFVNPHRAHSYQHTVADQLTAMIAAGLTITTVREYPYANGCRINASLVEHDGRRYTTPEGAPSLPLMLGVVATRAH